MIKITIIGTMTERADEKMTLGLKNEIGKRGSK